MSKCHLLPSDLTLQILGAGCVPATDKEGVPKARERENADSLPRCSVGNSEENKSKVVTMKGALIKGADGGALKV